MTLTVEIPVYVPPEGISKPRLVKLSGEEEVTGGVSLVPVVVLPPEVVLPPDEEDEPT